MVNDAGSTAPDYTGDVTAGAGPDVRELAHLRITKVAVDEQMSNNCYLLTCRATGEQVVVEGQSTLTAGTAVTLAKDKPKADAAVPIAEAGTQP